MNEPAVIALIDELRRRGVRLATRGTRLRVSPALPDDLRDEFLAQRDELWRAVHFKERWEATPANLAALQRFCPMLWSQATLDGDRPCLLWGVTARSVIVLPYGSYALQNVEPERLGPSETEASARPQGDNSSYTI